jgi:RHS repeat-associated protein
MTYAANGNISTKSDIGTTTFGYGDNAGPYALTGVTSSTGVIPTTDQAATYTSFEKVSTLTEGAYAAAFVYNSDNQRAKMDVTQDGSNILARWYAGSCYMKETAGGVTKEYTYIGGDAYTAPVAAVTQGGTTTYYYLLRDYLGNITNVYNATTGTNDEFNFDAWGRRRSTDDWSYTLDGNDLALFADRGFTGHEHLTMFNLVNMNGRLYDPLVGRFLNSDPKIAFPDFSQAYNRYSYCLNNPLKYNDPSGETPLLLALAIVWAGNYVIGLLDNVINKKMSLKEAFRNTSFIIGVNVSPNDLSKKNNFGVSNPQVDAQKLAKQQEQASKKVNKAIEKARASGNQDNDPTLTFKDTKDLFLQGGVKLETYTTKTSYEGTSHYEIVSNIDGIESFSYTTPSGGTVSKGVDGSFTYGNSIVSSGLDKYGNLIIDFSLPTGKDTRVGSTLYLSKQPLENLENAVFHSFDYLPRNAFLPGALPNPYFYYFVFTY